MDSLEKLKIAADAIVGIANEISSQTMLEIRKQAPVFVYHMLCREFTNAMKSSPDKTKDQIPEAMELMSAIQVLMKYYPELSKL